MIAQRFTPVEGRGFESHQARIDLAIANLKMQAPSTTFFFQRASVNTKREVNFQVRRFIISIFSEKCAFDGNNIISITIFSGDESLLPKSSLVG